MFPSAATCIGNIHAHYMGAPLDTTPSFRNLLWIQVRTTQNYVLVLVVAYIFRCFRTNLFAQFRFLNDFIETDFSYELFMVITCESCHDSSSS